MHLNTALVVTSISEPNASLKALAKGCFECGWQFYLVGDRSSPFDFQLEECTFLPIQQQLTSGFHLGKATPENCYARKNIGYLHAMKSGAEVIVETDDDNLPYDTFWKKRSRTCNARLIGRKGWHNVYSAFTEHNIWPRGFPLEHIHDDAKASTPSMLTAGHSPIQQGLADNNPDVDAIYRMTQHLPVYFEKRDDILLGPGVWCPFDSQNTTWFKESFPLLYLPAFCTFRMTDIWRSFVAQRIAWTCDWKILFHNATMFQERNDHILLRDFAEEIPGYLNNSAICAVLQETKLKNGAEHMHSNMRLCYEALVAKNYIDNAELKLLDAWLADVSNIFL